MIFPIKAVIFDADGILLDSLSVWKELGKRYITDLGYQPVAEMDEILFPMSMEQGADWLKNISAGRWKETDFFPFLIKSIPPVRSEKANILRGSILQLQKHWERSHPGRWLWRIHSTRYRLPEMQDF